MKRLGVLIGILLLLGGGLAAVYGQSSWVGCNYLTAGSNVTITCPDTVGRGGATIASAGAAGATGPTGPTGPTGATGAAGPLTESCAGTATNTVYLCVVPLTAVQIRALNSSAVTIIPGVANKLIVPGEVVFVGKQGSGAYSGAPQPFLQYTDGTAMPMGDSIDGSGSWDGTASATSVLANAALALKTSLNSASDVSSQVGLALQIKSGGDVTGGDATATVILTYRVYVLTGLL